MSRPRNWFSTLWQIVWISNWQGFMGPFDDESITPVVLLAFVRSIPVFIFSAAFIGLLMGRLQFVARLPVNLQKMVAGSIILGVVTSLGYTLYRGIGILVLILLCRGIGILLVAFRVP